MIHHIALGTQNPLNLSQFYQNLPGARFIRENHYPDGRIRSIWFQFGSMILMLEEGKPEAPKALVFRLENETSDSLEKDWIQFFKTVPIIEKTDFTFYFLDRDGNKLGLSTFPKNIFLILESS